MVKSYENLMGALGRSVHFRPERQRVRELLSRHAQPKLLIDGAEYPLFDISMNGLSFLVPSDDGWVVDRQLDLALVLHGEEAYRGAARIARVEPGPRGALIGIGLTGGFLDLHAFRGRDDEKKLQLELDRGHARSIEPVPAAYREVVARIVHFFQYYRRSLDYHERRYRGDGADDAAIMELVIRATDALRAPWDELQREASRAALECLVDRDVLLAAKRYTETLLVPCMLDIPLNNRAYLKPLGYPGDYQVMLYYYADGYEGDTVFTRAMHKLHMEHPLAVGVRTRKDLIVDLIEREHRQMVAERGEAADFRIVSLGCGPARETSDYIRRAGSWPGRMVWTLIDQEEKALSVAYRAAQSEVGAHGCACSLNLLNLSFVQMLSEGLPLREPGSQHFIYSTGLFDYVRESKAQTLLRGMYDLLAAGGFLTVGNAVAPNDHFWAPEFLGDWTILYRTRDEMRSLAALLPQEAELEITTEPSGAYYFLSVRKPS
jgi:SAM-dependent methyltransferase